jgi:hypothetical protein
MAMQTSQLREPAIDHGMQPEESSASGVLM